MAISETDFNKLLVKHIRTHFSLNAIKTSDRFTSGVPDIYVPGGNWIEGKLVPINVDGRVNAIGYFQTKQLNMMKRLMLGGDTCFVAVLFVDKTDGKRFAYMVVPFLWLLRYPTWTADIIWQWGAKKYEPRNINLESVFDNRHPRNLNVETLNKYYKSIEPHEIDPRTSVLLKQIDPIHPSR